MYQMKSPFAVSGSCVVFGQSYDIKPDVSRRFGVVEVPDLHIANFMVEHLGYQHTGHERIRQSKKIVIRRGRGIGDVLMVVPIARMLMKEDPEKQIVLACDIPKMDLAKYLPYFKKIIPLNRLEFHEDKVWVMDKDGQGREEYDTWLNLENLAEQDPEGAIHHRVDLFARAAGFSIPLQPGDRALEMRLSDEEAEAGKKRLMSLGWRPTDKLLAMAIRSTCENRNMPAHIFREVADEAARNGWKVLVLDHDSTFGWEGPGVINMTGKTLGEEENRQVASLLVHSTMFFGPDSGLWHMANALRVPNVVYFGAMDWKLRVTGPTRVLFRNVACYPCNTYGCHWHKKHACIDLNSADIWREIVEHNRQVAESSIVVTKPAPPMREGSTPQAVGVGA